MRSVAYAHEFLSVDNHQFTQVTLTGKRKFTTFSPLPYSSPQVGDSQWQAGRNPWTYMEPCSKEQVGPIMTSKYVVEKWGSSEAE